MSASPGQTERLLDLLARLSSHPSAPFERLLAMVARTVRPGTTVVVLTTRDPVPFLAHLRGIGRQGATILVITCGPKAAADAARARTAGLSAASRQPGRPVADRGSPGGRGVTTTDPQTAAGLRRAQHVIELTPVILVVIAEAAWVSVIGGFIQEVRLQAPVLGIPVLAVFVAFGVVTARTLGVRLGEWWAPVGLVLSVTAGAVGWLLAPDARAALLAGDLPTAIGHNPGGWVAGLAVLRGFANATFPVTEATCSRMLRLGIPGLALIALIGGAVAQPWRGIFLADTLIAAVVFVGAGTFALAFARQQTIGADRHVDWRRNRPWVVLLAGAVVVATILALAMAGAIGTAIPILFGLALGPLFIIGLVMGTDRRALRAFAYLTAAAVFVYLLLAFYASRDRQPPPPDTGPGTPTTPETDPTVIFGLGGLTVIVSVILILILLRLWMRQIGPVEADPSEIRTIDRGDGPSTTGRGPRRRRRTTPIDAVTAYVALIDDLDRRDAARRDPSETPAEHARRLRADGQGALGLDLLAADYALVRFGGIDLPEREDRKAVARWRSLRSRLGKG